MLIFCILVCVFKINFMSKKYLIVFFFLFYKLSAQTGINTQNPKTTFEVQGFPDDPNTVDGIIAPRLKLSELYAKNSTYGSSQKGTIIYVSNIDMVVNSLPDSLKYITVEGYYFFNGTNWGTLQDLTGIVLFIASLGNGDGTVVNQSFLSGHTAANFNRINMTNIVENIGGGIWNPTNRTFKIPLTGTYYVTASVRVQDNSPARDVFINVDSQQIDTESALWSYSANGLYTVQYARLGYYRAGEEVSLWFFGQNTTPTTPVNVSNATLSLLYLSSFGK